MRDEALHNSTQLDASAMRDGAADALALQSALLASVSHDLRSPLSVIRGASEVLMDQFAPLADEDRHSYLRAIRRECMRMDEYVQGVLHVTRLLVGGSARLTRDWVGIDELAGSAVERLSRYREEASVSIDIPFRLQLVQANAVLIEQALLNVLDNAVKFSPTGSIVTLHIAQSEHSTHIEIVDSGPGIPADQRERSFAMFVSDDPQARGRAGVGLGLAISRNIMRAHGGDVLAMPRGDGAAGARIHMSLPVREATGRGER